MPEPKDLREALSEIQKRIVQLANDLRAAAESLDKKGPFPKDDLDQNLSSTRVDFLQFWSDVSVMAAEIQSQPSTTSAKEPSVSRCEEILSAIEHAQDQRTLYYKERGQAVGVLQKILGVARKDEGVFPALRQCQLSAQNMREALMKQKWPDRHPEQESLARGTHPMAKLVRLIEESSTLTDMECDSLFDEVAASLGRLLALTALRGNLTIKSLETAEAAVGPQQHPTGTPSAGALPHSELSLPGRLTECTVETKLPADRVTEPRSVDQPAVEQLNELEEEAFRRGTGQEEEMEARGPSPELQDYERPIGTHAELRVLEAEPEIMDASSVQLAQYALKEDSTKRTPILNQLVWRLLSEREMGLAYFLGVAAQGEAPSLSTQLPAWILRLAAIGPEVRGPGGQLAVLVREDLQQYSEQCYVKNNKDWNHAVRLLLLSSCLHPTLLAPNTGAPRVVKDLHLKDGLDHLSGLCRACADYGGQGRPLDLNALSRIRGEAAWQAEMDDLQRTRERWATQAAQATIIYAPATKVWRTWMQKGGLIQEIIELIREDDPSKISRARQIITNLSHEPNIDREVHNTDRRVLKRRPGDKITARALGQIRCKVREATSLLGRWVDLRSATAERGTDYGQREAESLRERLITSYARVVQELECFRKSHNNAWIFASSQLCETRIKSLLDMFSPDRAPRFEEPMPRHLLNASLLRVPGIEMDEDWMPTNLGKPEFLDSLLGVIANGGSDLAVVFNMHMSNRDHAATCRIIEFMEAQYEDNDTISRLKLRREDQLHECREALRRDVEQTRRDLGGAVALGLIGEAYRNELIAEIEAVAGAIDGIEGFRPYHTKLEDVRRKIQDKRHSELAAIRRRLDSELPSNEAVYARISGILDNGDLNTANEYLNLALQGKPLPSALSDRNIFAEFFPGKHREIESFLEPERAGRERPNWGQIVTALKEYARGRIKSFRLGPVDMFFSGGSLATECARLVEAWFYLKKRETVEDTKHVQTILEAIGFRDVTISLAKSSKKRVWAEFSSRPLYDRNLCPVSAYGSQANGSYRALFVWDRPTEDDLLHEVGDTSVSSPVIVLHFGRLTEKKRRGLASLSRRRRRTFLVMDDVLVVFLCGEKGPRLPAFFACTLPFTFLEPYTTTAGLVPPEVFYGRSREKESVMAPAGSCFVYGGRQLGKTALLRDVQRSFHAPGEGRIAAWLDLKTRGVGYDRPIDDIWNVITTEMKTLKVVPERMPPGASEDVLLQHIQNWLEQDPRRRILLLLDEADRFLESDGRGQPTGKGQQRAQFVRAARLKGLMDRTNRRFKVVFAGLHNVQRTTRLANHPLAHYGEPICIGPLLEHGEMREAQALVETPFLSCGYSFESEELPVRILSQTNFYPSLIQLYCSHLLRHVNNLHTAGFDERESPPYVLKSKHVEDAYQSQDLRKAIRDRVIWTLQLDHRYEVVAYAIAYACLCNWEGGIVEGFSIPWIQGEAMGWWPEGFDSVNSEIPIESLLEEMVGLGILREVKRQGAPTHYTLRSPNVMLLMGTEEEIESQLIAPRETLSPYEPATFRSAYRGNDHTIDLSKRNPLSALQEQELRAAKNGVSIVFGSVAAGLSDLEDFLRIGAPEYFVKLQGIADEAGISNALEELSDRCESGTTLLLISHTSSYPGIWIERALERVQRLTSASRFARVVFIADPEMAWSLNQAQYMRILESVHRISLTPWHDLMLRQWLDDCGFQVGESPRRRITEVTGNWPTLLADFYRRSCDDIHHWEKHLDALSSVLKEPGYANDRLREFGVARPDGVSVLRDLAELGEAATCEDLVGVGIEAVPDKVELTLRWAGSLCLVHQNASDQYTINPVLGRILSTAGREDRK